VSWLREKPHRRRNLLTGEWVLVSPHRATRPWQGQVETASTEQAPQYDPTCYLCPGNERAGGRRNPHYEGCFVFDNDFAALLPSEGRVSSSPWFAAEEAGGVCRVLCFSPDHSLTFAKMTANDAQRVVAMWKQQSEEMFGRAGMQSVQIFENRGAMMGASNPHPHGQLWATDFVPPELERECLRQAERPNLLVDYLREERRAQERLVGENETWMALVPFWAVWPFETLVAPKRRAARLTDLTAQEEADLAAILRQLAAAYDALFSTPFPYTTGIHQAPECSQASFHLHIHFFPPLLRSATIRKFMVGFEMLAMPQRDITAESAAERLRAALNA
jgi:UDPglucose--hexose-1-phosphate uridylyltransferase